MIEDIVEILVIAACVACIVTLTFAIIKEIVEDFFD